MINSYSIVGEVAESATTLPNGGYAKLRLKLTNSLNRTEMVEVVSKVGDWPYLGQSSLSAGRSEVRSTTKGT